MWKLGVSRGVITFYDERERTQTISLGPKVISKWERMWEFINNKEFGLEAAIPLKSA